MKIALPGNVRAELEGRLPADVTASWYASGDEAPSTVEGVEVAWVDVLGRLGVGVVIEAARDAKWITTTFAGVNSWPLAAIKERGLVLTNGAGINAVPVAEFAVMGVLAMAKNLPALIRGQDRREWPHQAPGVTELYDSRAIILGYGHIGREIGKRLEGFGVKVTGVRRTPSDDPNVIGPDAWRARLGEYDWIVLAAAATGETARMIGVAELAAMKPSAVIVNIARGSLIDQAALIAAAGQGRIAGAFLDVSDPEPPSTEDPIWSARNIVFTCHCSGRAQTRMPERAAALFLDNLERYRSGRPLLNRVDLDLGY